MLAADLALAADEARIGDAHSPFAIMPGGQLYAGPSATNRDAASEGGDLDWALVQWPRDLRTRFGRALRATGAADSYHRGSGGPLPVGLRTCLAEVKAVTRSGIALNLKAAARLETKHFMAYLKRSQDATEGFRAYGERRVPRWES